MICKHCSSPDVYFVEYTDIQESGEVLNNTGYFCNACEAMEDSADEEPELEAFNCPGCNKMCTKPVDFEAPKGKVLICTECYFRFQVMQN